MPDELTVSTIRPSECSSAELAEICSLVRSGGEVMEAGVEQRIKEAKALFLVRDGEGLVAVAALKNPRPTYRASVFRKAAAKNDPKVFRYELGWIFVVPSSRGKGLSHALVSAAVGDSMGAPIFATCRVDNVAMHRSLLSAGFHRHGEDYNSERGSYRLALFLFDTSRS